MGIAGGVHVGRDEMDMGAGDQGIMFGYASDETEDCMPLTYSIATRLGKKLTDVRKSGDLWWLRPDGKTQVTKNGIKFFEWENAKDLSKFKSMDGAQVQAELTSSNYLKKWVDLVARVLVPWNASVV